MQTSRRAFLSQCAVGAAAFSAPRVARPADRPNVVIVMTDDQGYGDITKHGNTELKTPHLDALYDESVRLTNFHVSPTCSPTRAALMTGRYNNRTGVWHTIMGRSLLRKDEITVADAFSDAGYRTGIFGKWHLGDNYPFRAQDRGFQETFIHGGGGVGQMPDYWGNDYIDDTYFRNGTPEKCEGYCTDVWFDGAMQFIEGNRDTPFFCYLPTNAPHGPYTVPDKWAQPYRDMGIDSPRAQFYGMVANIDWNVGRLTAHLDRLGIVDNTILIFMTDNGTSAGMFKGKGFNGGMRGQKGSEYEGGHRVPCFVRWPGGNLAHGKDVGRLSAHIDVFPTLLELCGIEGAPHGEFDGRSLAPILHDPRADWDDRMIVTDSQRIDHPEKWRKSAVMWHQYRYINGKELYDLESDPGQKKNIVEDQETIARTMRAEYDRWWADISERFDEYCPHIIGHNDAPSTRLISHDWHGEKVPWNQPHIRSGMAGTGFWAIDVARDGDYRFALRRWPKELDMALTAAPANGAALGITGAHMRIGDINLRADAEADAKEIAFTSSLKAGEHQLETRWDIHDTDLGAYYVYVDRA